MARTQLPEVLRAGGSARTRYTRLSRRLSGAGEAPRQTASPSLGKEQRMRNPQCSQLLFFRQFMEMADAPLAASFE